MGLFETLSEMEKSICNKKKESKEDRLLKEIREDVKLKDFKYWEDRVKRMSYINDVSHDTAEYEYLKDKAIAEYQRDALVYDVYQKIVEEPKKMKELLRKLEIEKQSYDKLLESLESIKEGLQLQLN